MFPFAKTTLSTFTLPIQAHAASWELEAKCQQKWFMQSQHKRIRSTSILQI